MTMKRIFVFALVLALLVSALPFSALAMTPEVYSKAKAAIASFPDLYYLVSGKKQYVYALQSYLMRFDDNCKAKLRYGNTYMDGEYGGRTRAAVAYAQSVLNISSDGYAGPKTWDAISNSLAIDGDGLYRLYSGLGNCFYVIPQGTDNLPNLCYINEDGKSQYLMILS